MPLGLVIAGLAALIVLWNLPQPQVGRVRGLDSKERFDRVNEARKTLATILGGVVLLAGFFGTWQNLRVAQENLRVSEEGQITDRFTKAIEQLDAVYPDGKTPKLDVRVGGIYGLARIANDSEKDYWPIMEVLCTYVREHVPRKESDHAKSSSAETRGADGLINTHHPTADVHAIMTVLGKRDRKYEKEGQFLNLANVDLRGADLYSAYLHGADLSGADLSGAYLSRAVLSWARLSGADLSGADLSHTKELTQEQIDGAVGDEYTTLPDNLHMP